MYALFLVSYTFNCMSRFAFVAICKHRLCMMTDVKRVWTCSKCSCKFCARKLYRNDIYRSTIKHATVSTPKFRTNANGLLYVLFCIVCYSLHFFGSLLHCLVLCLSVECEIQRQCQSNSRQFQHSTDSQHVKYRQQSILIGCVC